MVWILVDIEYKYLSTDCTEIEPTCNPQQSTTIRNQLFLNYIYNKIGFAKVVINAGVL